MFTPQQEKPTNLGNSLFGSKALAQPELYKQNRTVENGIVEYDGTYQGTEKGPKNLGVAKSSKSLFLLSCGNKPADSSIPESSLLSCCKTNVITEPQIAQTTGVELCEISCWPCLPKFKWNEMVTFEFNDSGNVLLIASVHRVVVVHLHPLHDPYNVSKTLSRRNSAIVSGILNISNISKDAAVPLSLEGVWQVPGGSGNLFPSESIVFDGEVTVSGSTLTFKGSLTGDREGTFELSSSSKAGDTVDSHFLQNCVSGYLSDIELCVPYYHLS